MQGAAADEYEGYNAAVEGLRKTEYPMLRETVYLDHAGSTLCAKSLMDEFARDMMSHLFGNPHSTSASSQLATSRIEDVRLRVLRFFSADPNHYNVVFVANATAGIKLVAEAMRAGPEGFDFVYHQASHTSLVGVREEARNSVCLDDQQVRLLLAGRCSQRCSLGDDAGQPVLFAYPAQSNLDGKRFPLAWASEVRHSLLGGPGKVYTLLDAASLAATSPLDLSSAELAPDFVVLSFYKIFGFPDLGALIVRRQAEPAFNARRYFGGGTVDTVVCGRERWHAPKQQFLHERLEDGTLPIHSIVALDVALNTHCTLFGSMSRVAEHTAFLTARLHRGLSELRHCNGKAVCTIYSPIPKMGSGVGVEGDGPIVAFNVRTQLGAWISGTEFDRLASLKNFHVRSGGACNPGGVASALGLEPWEIRSNFSSGFRCGTENEIVSGKPTGVIRASLGAMSTMSDVDSFTGFLDEFFAEKEAMPATRLAAIEATDQRPGLVVRSITVYPIKSCGGFAVPEGVDWEVRQEGLAWDREWCLVHRGSRQALSQSRYPRMALIRPSLDFDSGQLRVTYVGSEPGRLLQELHIPLSICSDQFLTPRWPDSLAWRVCGDELSSQGLYTSPLINDFFSDILGVPCVLARLPSVGCGTSIRHSKARFQPFQLAAAKTHSQQVVPRAFPDPSWPPPPDSNIGAGGQRILLSNESPILAVSMASVDALNQDISASNGVLVSPAVFRANLVLGAQHGSASSSQSFAEDSWSRVRIGQQNFKMLGACRRCHMICINPETAEKRDEPFVTLSRTRRLDGKVFFGVHMAHVPSRSHETRTKASQHPTIRVGDAVQPT